LNLGEIVLQPLAGSEEERFQALMEAHHYLGALAKIGHTLWYSSRSPEHMGSLPDLFADIPDPRRGQGRRNDYLDFPGVGQVFVIERPTIEKTTAKRSTETVYGVTSHTPGSADAAGVLAFNRGHWTVENGCH
jgi:hypothetical protein